MEIFRQDECEQHCGNFQFVQDNHPSSGKGILRGLQYQLLQPQGKLKQVTRGEVFDVAVDMRQRSPTFGRWVGAYLSDSNEQLLQVPPGFAHGFYAACDTAEFQYKCIDYYNPADEYSLLWNDPTISVELPLNADGQILSAKDKDGKLFNECPAFD